jgi:hypothetical protein
MCEECKLLAPKPRGRIASADRRGLKAHLSTLRIPRHTTEVDLARVVFRHLSRKVSTPQALKTRVTS